MFEYLVFNEDEAFSLHREIRLEMDGDKLRYSIDSYGTMMIGSEEKSGIYRWDTSEFLQKLEAFDVRHWKDQYYIPACDGYGWDLRYKEVGKPCKKIYGSNDCPECYEQFVKLLFSVSQEVKMLDYLRYTESENGVLFRKYEIKVRDGKLVCKYTGPYFLDEEAGEHVYGDDVFSYLKKLCDLDFMNWQRPYVETPMLDGMDWILEYRFSGEPDRMLSGSGEGPANIQEFVFALDPVNVREERLVI